jgi:putative ABC transport system permease protein
MFTDFRYALRTLSKSSGFAVIAILTLALGIGANTAIFSVVNGVLLRPLPFRDSDRIVDVWTSTKDEQRGNHSAGDFIDLQQSNQSLAALAGYRSNLFSAAARGREPVQLAGEYVTVDFFDVLGVSAAVGRTFTRASDGGSRESFVVLSDEAWHQLFTRDAHAVGERIRVNGEPHTVLGVLRPKTEWPQSARIWILSSKPVPPSPIESSDAQTEREVQYFNAIARLKPGITLQQGQQDVHRVALDIHKQHPRSAGARDIRLAPIREGLLGGVKSGLLVLQFAVGLVLLIACANVSSLLIARATARRRELAIRAALGARRGRLIRQLLTESLVLSVIGGLAGVLLGTWLTTLLVRVLPEAVPRAGEIAMDRIVAFSTLLTALVTGALFGVMPALQASRADANAALKQAGERGSAGRARARAAMVTSEIALTLVLLVGAGLLLNSFLRLAHVDSGMGPENVTVAGLVLPQSRYPKAASQIEVYRRVVEGLSRHGEVQAVGVGFPGPLRGSNASAHFEIERRRSADRSDRPFAHIGTVSGGYFAAMGVPLLAGRTFTESDTATAPGVAIVSVTLARKYWPGENPLGRRLRFDESDNNWATVVGVVGDVRQLGLDELPPPIVYMSYQQFPLPFTNIAVRSTAAAEAIERFVRAQLAAIDPDLPPNDISTLQGVLDRSVDQPRFRTLLLIAFAVLALVLAAIGVYGLISYSVAQRTREIGIRLALGAQPRQVMIPVLREAIALALAGIGIGLIAALASGRVLSGFLFDVRPTDPLTLASVALLLLTVAVSASYIPSRRTLRIDPVSALRAE